MISRRAFLFGAPAIVAASSLMPVSVWAVSYDKAAVEKALAEFLIRHAKPRPFSADWYTHAAHPVRLGLLNSRQFNRDYTRPWYAPPIIASPNVEIVTAHIEGGAALDRHERKVLIAQAVRDDHPRAVPDFAAEANGVFPKTYHRIDQIDRASLIYPHECLISPLSNS